MSDGRTSWWAKDAAWWRREPVVELLEEVGLAGPAIVDWLACEAKAQNAGGVVKAGERTIARALGLDLVTVGHALSRAVTVGLLDDMERSERTFTCRISGWKSEQERALATRRKALQREKIEPCHGVSRPVTKCPPTGQDSTYTDNPPSPPAGGSRPRARREYNDSLGAWGLLVVPEADPSVVGAATKHALTRLKPEQQNATGVRWIAATNTADVFGLGDEVRAAIRREFKFETTEETAA